MNSGNELVASLERNAAMSCGESGTLNAGGHVTESSENRGGALDFSGFDL
jgi:hypothetical protein